MEFLNDEEQLPEIEPEEFLRQKKQEMRRRSFWGIGVGTVIVLISIGATWFLMNSPEYLEDLELKNPSFFSILFRNILFLLGLFFAIAGIWGLYEARKMTLQDFVVSPEAIEFLRQAQEIRPFYSYIIVGCLITVFIVQMLVGNSSASGYKAIEIAGLVKPDTWQKGEYWRILTSGVMHGGFLHIYFNAQAFHGFGVLIEVLSNRARMAIVFLLAIVGGGVLSMIFMPEGTTVGASGGIMGLIGYLAIYGYRRKNQLPPNFLRSMLTNIGFVAAFGLVGYQFIDNFAHLGGLLVGLVYGFLSVPRDLSKNPREIGAITDGAGMIAMGVIVFISIFTVLLITEKIVL